MCNRGQVGPASRTAEDYGKFALEAAKLMKWTDPNVKLIAAGSSNFGAGPDWTGWNRTVPEHLKNHADYLSVHSYVGNTQNDYEDFVASSLELGSRIKPPRGSSMPPCRACATAHVVKIANMAQLVNVIAPIFTNEKGLFLQTIYYPLQLFANHTKGKALELFVDSAKYKSRRFDEVPYLDASASLDNGSLVLNAVNRHRDQVLEAEIEIQDKQFSGPVEVTEVNGPDLKAENNFDSAPVRPVERSVAAQGKTLRFRFPPHSYVMLKAKVV